MTEASDIEVEAEAATELQVLRAYRASPSFSPNEPSHAVGEYPLVGS